MKKKDRPWWIFSTYFSEGVPFYFFRNLIPLFLKEMGYTNAISAMSTLVAFPWNIKVFWSHLVDFYSTKKKWVVALEFLIGFIFLLLAAWSHFNSTAILQGGYGYFFWSFLLVGCILAASQDIAIDAAYIENLSDEKQAYWSGARVAAYRAAIIFVKTVIVVIAAKLCWAIGFITSAAVFFILGLIHLKTLPSPIRVKKKKNKSSWIEFRDSFRSFMQKDRAIWILLFAFFYKIGDAFLFGMSNLFLKDMQIKTINIGILGTTDFLFMMAGSVVSGWIISKVGLKRCLLPFAIAMNFADFLYVGYAIWSPSMEIVQKTGFILTGLEQFVGAFGTAAYMVFFMQMTSKQHAASHYAFLTSIMSIEVFITSSGGFISDLLGWPVYFTFCFCMSIPGMWIILKVLPLLNKSTELQEKTIAC